MHIQYNNRKTLNTTCAYYGSKYYIIWNKNK